MNRTALLAVLPFIAGHAAAQDAAWTVDVGAAARTRPTHIGSSRYVVDSVPVLEADYGDSLRISFDDGARWSAAQLGPFAFGPVVEYRQSFNDHLPAGAFRMNDAIEVGGFTTARTPVGLFEARLRRAVNGYGGWSGDLSFDTGGQVAAHTLVGGQLRVSWADSNFTQEYFGLRPHAARHLGLPRFLDEDFVTAGGEFDVSRDLARNTRLVLALSADRILGELRPSPLLGSRDIYTASLGLTYHWSSLTPGRSK